MSDSMNSKICSGTVVSTATYAAIYDEDLSTYDPDNLLFPRDGATLDENGWYIDAWAIMAGDDFDVTRREEIEAMPEGADLANELCLLEYEYHAFADSEGTAGFCCQAFMQDITAFGSGWRLWYHFLVNTETLEDSAAVVTFEDSTYGEEDVAFGASWIAVEETPEPEEEDDEEEEAARAKGAVTLASLAALLAIFTQ